MLVFLFKVFKITWLELIGQSHDFWRAYSLFVAWVASFAPERSKGANDATRDKLYAQQKSCDYHHYQYTRQNRTNSFNKKKMFNRDVAWNYGMESCCYNTIS